MEMEWAWKGRGNRERLTRKTGIRWARNRGKGNQEKHGIGKHGKRKHGIGSLGTEESFFREQKYDFRCGQEEIKEQSSVVNMGPEHAH